MKWGFHVRQNNDLVLKVQPHRFAFYVLSVFMQQTYFFCFEFELLRVQPHRFAFYVLPIFTQQTYFFCFEFELFRGQQCSFAFYVLSTCMQQTYFFLLRIELFRVQPKLQALVHDILPPSTTVSDYAIGLKRLSANSFSLVLKWQ